jgi:hypothetical protein
MNVPRDFRINLYVLQCNRCVLREGVQDTYAIGLAGDAGPYRITIGKTARTTAIVDAAGTTIIFYPV